MRRLSMWMHCGTEESSKRLGHWLPCWLREKGAPQSTKRSQRRRVERTQCSRMTCIATVRLHEGVYPAGFEGLGAVTGAVRARPSWWLRDLPRAIDGYALHGSQP